MILSLLMSLVSIYPWNIGVTGYAVSADYTNENTYWATSEYISFDRKHKDLIVLGYDYEEIDFGDGLRVMRTLSGRGSWWASSVFRPSASFSYTISGRHEGAWLGGIQAEGDFSWIGYSASYTRKTWELQGQENEGYGWDEQVEQYGIFLHRYLGPHRVDAGYKTQRIGDNWYSLTVFSIYYRINYHLSFAGEHGFGNGRYMMDPFLLVFDTNPDILEQYFKARLTYRLSANYSVIGSYTRKDFTPAFSRNLYWDYGVQFYSLGVQARF